MRASKKKKSPVGYVNVYQLKVYIQPHIHLDSKTDTEKKPTYMLHNYYVHVNVYIQSSIPVN